MLETYINYINTLYPESIKRCTDFYDNTELIHASLGVAGEAGEVIDIIKKHVAYGKILDKGKLALELGDLLHYMCRVMVLTDISFDDVVSGNVDKLTTRYPDGYTNENAILQLDNKKET